MNGRTIQETPRFFDWALLLGDLAAATWLWFSYWSYTDRTVFESPRIWGPALATAALAVVFGLHRPRPERKALLLLRLAGLALVLAALVYFAGSRKWMHASGKEALWLGAASAGILWVFRSLYWRAADSKAGRAWEMLRWLAIGAAATLVMLPFYFAGSIGAGDAHWYVLMLSDFIAQLRAGVFPVWVGQSTYAFNGAVSPLRYAPGFQYFGGLLDLLTAHALQPVALKNLCLSMAAIGGAFSAYACMRPITRGRPWIACILSILWIAGPGVLAPVTSGDQYMTFVALPFVPVVLHGCWRVWELDDWWGRFWIAAGLAGLWICHSPIGLWMSVLSAALYIPTVLIRCTWRRELGCVALMAAVFLVLGSLPFISVLNLNNQISVPSYGMSAAAEVHRMFPVNFKPIDLNETGLADYQIGYALLGTLIGSLLLMALSRPRGAWAFALGAVMIAPFTVPVPMLTDAIWSHIPVWFVTINNVWPMQRLFLVWSSLIVFAAAIVLGSPRISGASLRHAIVIGALALGCLWSGYEAYMLAGRIGRTRSSPAQARIMEGPENTQLGRYAYSSFAYTPGYASHGYMDPWFENRLLERQSLEPLLTNADGAAPGDSPGAEGAAHPKLLQKGTMTAENITNSDYYLLRPDLLLDTGKRYALRLEFLEPGLGGLLQIAYGGMLREYILPDSGGGMFRRGPPRAFGSLATSGRVLSLIGSATGLIAPKALLITPRPVKTNFAAAKYWLYAYDRSRLPIVVESWMPYRVRFESPRAAYLESPRVWLRGWRATVNGRTVAIERSPENLVMVPVEAGANNVTLEFQPPVVLRASFWLCFASWLGLGAAALGWLLKGGQLQSAPA